MGPTRAEIIRDALTRIPTFSNRLKSVESFIERSAEPNHELRIKLFERKSMLTELDGLPEPPFDSFDSKWDAGLHEDYLAVAQFPIMGRSQQVLRKSLPSCLEGGNPVHPCDQSDMVGSGRGSSYSDASTFRIPIRRV